MLQKITIFISSLFLISCASKALLDVDDIKVTRDAPAAHCKPVGKVVGRVITFKQTREDAMKDLKQNAANKGANFVQIAQVSDHGTSITGHAFICDAD